MSWLRLVEPSAAIAFAGKGHSFSGGQSRIGIPSPDSELLCHEICIPDINRVDMRQCQLALRY